MDFEERKKLFQEWVMTDYKSKMDELHCDMFSYPLFVPDGQGGFRIVIQTDIVDTTNMGMKSPFSPE